MAIYEKLAAFQKNFTGLTLDSVNPHFKNKYCSLDNLVNKVRPELAKHGLGYTHCLFVRDNMQLLKTVVYEGETGETLESEIIVPPNDNPQKIGSALTYYRRYTLAGLLGVVEEADDDGNGASSVKAPKGKDSAHFEKLLDKSNPPDIATLAAWYETNRAEIEKMDKINQTKINRYVGQIKKSLEPVA